MQLQRMAEALGAVRNQTFEAENVARVNAMRGLAISERESTIQDALAKNRLAALNSGLTMADIQSEQYQNEEARLTTILNQESGL